MSSSNPAKSPISEENPRQEEFDPSLNSDSAGSWLRGESDWGPDLDPEIELIHGDARDLPLEDESVDLVVTSPPYWKKRDYGIDGQIGQEATPNNYVQAMLDCLGEWSRVLTPTGSVFLNIGDSFYRRSLAGIPGRLEAEALDSGWRVRNRIIWAKDRGMPEPVKDRSNSSCRGIQPDEPIGKD